MRFLIIDDHYPERFLAGWCANRRTLGQRNYREGWRLLMDEGLGVGDFYSEGLRALGHEAAEIVPNCEPLQRLWVEEQGVDLARTGIIDRLRRLVGRGASPSWINEIVAAQIERIRPDVLINHGMGRYDRRFLARIRPFVKLIVGQHASPIPPNVPFDCYDLMLSSLPNLVSYFRRLGLKSEYVRLGFGASILASVAPGPAVYEVSFIGGYSSAHGEGTKVLEQVAGEVPVDFWGYGADMLSPGSPIHRRYHGEVWGLEMYRILAQSKIVLNRHIHVAENYANNMRLYEATGMGALLITDMKDNLNGLFEVGKEVVAYRSAEECIGLVKYYLRHEDERSMIAGAGQQRTLREHTYHHRMRELVDIAQRYLP
ncbi:MAG: glycosyltransferase [Nitrospirota bacterium]